MAMMFTADARTIREVIFDDSKISIPQFVAICRYDAKVTFTSAYEERVRASRKALEDKLVERQPIYGVNTGFGDNVRFAVSDEDLTKLQVNILRSHPCSVGESLSREHVRGLLLMLLVTVGHGYSAVRFQIQKITCQF